MTIDAIVVTEGNIDEVRFDLPLDQAEELRPGCITWFTVNAEGTPTWITIWPDLYRAAVCWNMGNSAWGDWDDTDRVIVLDETSADGAKIVVDENGNETVEPQPWW